MQTNWKGSIVPALIMGCSIVVLGLCLKSGIDNYVNRDRNVTVKGLAEREVSADKVTWTVTTKETGNDLKELYATISEKNKVIRQFLLEGGVKEADITLNAPTVEDYVSQGSYQQDARYRYAITSKTTVVSKDVDKVRTLILHQGDLLNRGVALVQTNSWESEDVKYEYTKFKEIKADMMKEAIKNAQQTADQFASTYGSKLGKSSLPTKDSSRLTTATKIRHTSSKFVV